MGFWAFYFFAKIAAYLGGFIGFHVAENFAFALLTALPLRHRGLRFAKLIVALPLGIALLWHDSWLPPWRRVAAQWDQISDFSVPYVIELAQRFVNPRLLLGLFLLLLLYWLLSRKLRMSTFAALGILVAPWLAILTGAVTPAAPVVAAPGQPPADAAIVTGTSTQDLNAQLDEFYLREQRRRLRIPHVEDDGQPYDIVLLQICSLAWDDIDFVGAREHPLLTGFDVRFDRFNAAASYSGPAAIRLLRSTCGQTPHDELYAESDPGCLLMSQLQVAGFEPQWAMNHQGIYGGMFEDIHAHGGLAVPLMPLAGLQPFLRSFDGVENGYFSDYDVLSRWWQRRLQQDSARVALYYNTGTLHDGNHFLDGSRPGVRESYSRRLQTLFAQVQRFIGDIEASGRRAIVVLVPEHGANVRGDRMQISGLREIPSPAIGLVPVGVRLVGRPAAPAPLTVDHPASLFAMSTLLAGFVAHNPYAEGAPSLSQYIEGLPQTPYVAENDGTVVMEAGGRYWQSGLDREWSEYRPGR